jgi:hypothetical protein
VTMEIAAHQVVSGIFVDSNIPIYAAVRPGTLVLPDFLCCSSKHILDLQS